MALDAFHHIVRRALEHEGWTVTDEPLVLNDGETEFEIDLAAERFVIAQKEKQQIAVEIKTFLARSRVHEFHGVLGQYLDYRLMLELTQNSRELYLAVPEVIWKTLLQRKFFQRSLEYHRVRLIVYNEFTEVITQWI
jgi:hypothetical protein